MGTPAGMAADRRRWMQTAAALSGAGWFTAAGAAGATAGAGSADPRLPAARATPGGVLLLPLGAAPARPQAWRDDVPVLVVGHQPTLGQVAACVLGMRESDCAIKKGAVWWLRYRVRDGVAQTLIRTVQLPELM